MANRKLQGEIDRVLKRVDEGVQIFEQIWDKVYSAATTAQKEKYEGDLKKEIKKLQRLRDQIKTWQGDSSIKDKTKLDQNRKLIEEKMEKFKVCEKETKTKAFSKEGLAQDRTDPKQKAKAVVGDWVRDAIGKLTEQCEEMEAEIETLNSGKRKKRNDENPRVTQLKEFIGRHEHHQEMLERVLRAVYNDAVVPEEAEELKESVDYYIDSNQDPDFFEDDEMYDALNLEATPTPLATVKKGKTNDRDEEESEVLPTVTTPTAPTTTAKKGSSSPRNAKLAKLKDPAPVLPPAIKTSTSPTARTVSPKSTRSEPVPNPVPNGSVATPTTVPAPLAISPHSPRKPALKETASTLPTQPLLSSVVKGAGAPGKNVVRAGVSSPTLPRRNAVGRPEELSSVLADRPIRNETGLFAPAESRAEADGRVENNPFANGRREAEIEAGRTNALLAELAAVEAALPYMPESMLSDARGGSEVRGRDEKWGGKLDGEGEDGGMLERAARYNVSSKAPMSFPSVSMPIFDSRQVFERFDPDTLFFIFYYQQGTYQQYLAASELKRQGWRFHKKYLTWFQRHDEPKVSTDDYETGTFIYFDYANVVVRGQGSGWCQRIKSEFIFEYQFLEDELV